MDPSITTIKNNINIDIFVTYSLGIIGVILSKFFPSEDNKIGLIIGNTCIVITLVIVLFMILNNKKISIKKTEQTEQTEQSFKINMDNLSFNKILVDGLPITILILGIIYFIMLNIIYSTNITLPDYNIYENISSYIVIIQLLLIYKYSWHIIIKNKDINNTMGNIFIILLGIINLGLVTIMHIMLKNYIITDN